MCGLNVSCDAMSNDYTEVRVEDTDWEYEHELALLDDDLKLIADKCRADETKKMVNAIEVS